MIDLLLTVLTILLVPIALFLIIIILLQESKSGGLTGAFGGSGTELLLGARAGKELSRLTVYGMIIFTVILITIGILCQIQQKGSASQPPAKTKEAGEALKKAPPISPGKKEQQEAKEPSHKESKGAEKASESMGTQAKKAEKAEPKPPPGGKAEEEKSGAEKTSGKSQSTKEASGKPSEKSGGQKTEE